MKRAYWITSVDITIAHGTTEEVYSSYLADNCTLYEFVSYLRALYPHSVFVKIEHKYRFVHESDNGHGKVNNPLFDEDFDFTW